MEPYLTTEQAAEYVKLSKARIYRLVAEKRIPFHRREPGAAIRFRASDLDAWMAGDWKPDKEAA